MIDVVTRYMGDQDTPKQVKFRRRTIYDFCRRLGQPVLVKKLLTTRDEQLGLAIKSPNWRDAYGNVRSNDPLSHGGGYVSIELSTTEWIDPNGNIVPATALSPPNGYSVAPQYRGFGQGFLTYVVLPDVPTDYIKIDSTGALIAMQTQAICQAPWYPDINDGDLVIPVLLGRDGQPKGFFERYQAHQCRPTTGHGNDRRGLRQRNDGKDHGNRYTVNQTFQLNTILANHPLSAVEVDR